MAHPWSLAFLPGDQGMLITLRGGELKRWQPGKGLSAPIAGVPQVWANGQGGLLDVALAPDFAQSRR
ncbi:PQQ-dependent sugar dehydrogenase, partial [Acinetobacter baumannii]|uniref:PQQ-dependent sugar dehydrogenase n=1 Tax=Acinetobacter baumannii TaxID=470 RepID=UPI003C715455